MTKTPTINRRGWLATWLQDRRRARQHKLLPAPVLAAAYPDLAVWSWDYPNPAYWYAYHQHADGEPFTYDDRGAGTDRQYAPDGGQYLMFIVGVDADGNEVTERSNAVRPDDAAAPGGLVAPVATSMVVEEGEYGFIQYGATWEWAGDEADGGSFEVYIESPTFPPAWEVLVTIEAGITERSVLQEQMGGSYFPWDEPCTRYARVRYVLDGVYSAYSNRVQFNWIPP